MWIVRLCGFADEAAAFMQARAAKRRAQDIANMPTTKRERANAADHGDL